jgi:hypothetical protein
LIVYVLPDLLTFAALTVERMCARFFAMPADARKADDQTARWYAFFPRSWRTTMPTSTSDLARRNREELLPLAHRASWADLLERLRKADREGDKAAVQREEHYGLGFLKAIHEAGNLSDANVPELRDLVISSKLRA